MAKRADAAEKPFKKSRKVVVDVSLCRYAIIKRCLKARDFRLVREKKADVEWDIWWSDRGELLKDARRLNAFQKVNHFPSMEDICRKDFLANNLNAMRKLLPDDFDFFPRSFLMPSERMDLQQYMAQDKKGATYIVKPRTLCQGKGIRLVQAFQTLSPTEPCVVQKYIHNPLLIDGFKFDLRIYVFVYSVDPLRVYIFRNGLARFCTTPFAPPTRANLHQTRMHLTNYAINKKSKSFVKSTDESQGSKRSLAFVMAHLAKLEFDADVVWDDICAIVLKTLLAIQPRLAASYRNFFGTDDAKGRQWGPAAFEILGFDIMLDERGKAWMVEVNHAPSFAGDSKLDKQIKTPLIALALDLLDVTNQRKRAYQAKNRKAWKSRLWNVAAKVVKGSGEAGLVEPPPPAMDPQVVDLVEESAVEPVEDDDNNGSDPPSEDERDLEPLHPVPRRIVSGCNKVHPGDDLVEHSDDNQGNESNDYGNVYQLIYPPPTSALQARYARILAAAETNRSKHWG
ncbi:Aste57867_14423 [Aphanomyces stellatus]|uniref:Aste57867_14423 protein n=1 Tax=Aphanomyces stellatus TaxID=120398 RepID=A0A485L0N3_9STRA|nr:hypothetical protein As57867_014369 [Aphanomyces stellatus]VFT91245.1 Aste57867_14423 [Aphanomyces stellatus]